MVLSLYKVLVKFPLPAYWKKDERVISSLPSQLVIRVRFQLSFSNGEVIQMLLARFMGSVGETSHIVVMPLNHWRRKKVEHDIFCLLCSKVSHWDEASRCVRECFPTWQLSHWIFQESDNFPTVWLPIYRWRKRKEWEKFFVWII